VYVELVTQCKLDSPHHVVCLWNDLWVCDYRLYVC